VYLQNSGSQAVTVLGQAGEPFAEIGPAGVRVNLRSPIYAADQLARGISPKVAPDPARPPLWRKLSASGSFDWLDPRPRLEERWTIPLRYGTEQLAITGGRRVSVAAPGAPGPAPRPGGSGTPWWVYLLAGIALAAAAAITVVLRRRT
jgi:hypothetical protein